MAKIAHDPEREQRIVMEAIVDCYDAYEQAMGWYYYISNRLHPPFTATWISQHPENAKTVQVVGMAHEDDCERELYVEIEFESDVFSVPLNSIEPADDTDPETLQAIGDWHYWVGQGKEFEDFTEEDYY